MGGGGRLQKSPSPGEPHCILFLDPPQNHPLTPDRCKKIYPNPKPPAPPKKPPPGSGLRVPAARLRAGSPRPSPSRARVAPRRRLCTGRGGCGMQRGDAPRQSRPPPPHPGHLPTWAGAAPSAAHCERQRQRQLCGPALAGLPPASQPHAFPERSPGSGAWPHFESHTPSSPRPSSRPGSAPSSSHAGGAAGPAPSRVRAQLGPAVGEPGGARGTAVSPRCGTEREGGVQDRGRVRWEPRAPPHPRASRSTSLRQLLPDRWPLGGLPALCSQVCGGPPVTAASGEMPEGVSSLLVQARELRATPTPWTRPLEKLGERRHGRPSHLGDRKKTTASSCRP